MTNKRGTDVGKERTNVFKKHSQTIAEAENKLKRKGIDTRANHQKLPGR